MYNRLRITALALVVASVAAPTPSRAEQILYRQTDQGWFIYREDLSCVMYADFGDLMLRISDRTDEGKVYLSVVAGQSWEPLRSRIGEAATLTLLFPALSRGLGSAALVIRNPDGRVGFSGADFLRDDLFRYFVSAGQLKLLATLQSETTEIADLQLTGAQIATMHLQECTAQFFPGR